MKYFISILLLLTISSFSQGYKSAKIAYGTVLEQIKNSKTEKNTMLEEFNESIKNKRLLLEINTKGVLFSESKPIDEKDRLKSKLISAVFLINNYYTSNKNKKTYKIVENLLIETTKEYDWELTNESKKIDGFLCYKANCLLSFPSRSSGQFSRLYTAWYAPEINFNSGPNGISGLPGLILELEFKNTKIVAKKIELFKENIKINFPKYKMINEEEFLKKTNENFN